jgi:hypothetical protein
LNYNNNLNQNGNKNKMKKLSDIDLKRLKVDDKITFNLLTIKEGSNHSNKLQYYKNGKEYFNMIFPNNGNIREIVINFLRVSYDLQSRAIYTVAYMDSLFTPFEYNFLLTAKHPVLSSSLVTEIKLFPANHLQIFNDTLSEYIGKSEDKILRMIS